MTLEQQVCSLELAKRLKKLEVKQESLYSYADAYKDGNHFIVKFSPEDTTGFSAYTVAELGEMLPPKYIPVKTDDKDGIFWFQYLQNPDTFIEAKTEADARARMLIYLLENKLISLASEPK